MRFGIRIPPCGDPRQVAACAAAAEAAGFEAAWLPDSQLLWGDVWSTLALAATATQRIALGPGVTNLQTRHPSVTAAAAATLDRLAPGRVRLGVGSGDSALKTVGLSPSRLARMREQSALLRKLLAAEPATIESREVRVRAATGAAVPLYLAATGPKALELAGEIADGVLVLAGFSPELIERAVARVAAGAARGGRGLGELDVCFGALCELGADEREAARAVKPHVVAMAQGGGGEALAAIGVEIELPDSIPEVYPDMAHAEDWDAAVDVAERWVDDEAALRFARAFCLVGSAEQCAERLAAAESLGVTSTCLRHPGSYTLPTELIAAAGAELIPQLAVPLLRDPQQRNRE